MPLLSNYRICKLLRYYQMHSRRQLLPISINVFEYAVRIFNINAVIRSRILRAIENDDVATVSKFLKLEYVKNLENIARILDVAVQHGNGQVAVYLLQDRLFKKHMLISYCSFLQKSIEHGQKNTIVAMMQILTIRNNAHAWSNWWLRVAIKLKKTDIALYLLTIEKVRERVHEHNNWVLGLAIKYELVPVFHALMNIQKVANTAHLCANKHLVSAVGSRRLDMALRLLQQRGVRRSVRCVHNRVLQTALQNEDLYIVNQLMKIPSVIAHMHQYKRWVFRAIYNTDLHLIAFLVKLAKNNLDHALRMCLRLSHVREIFMNDQRCVQGMQLMLNERLPYNGYIILMQEMPYVLRRLQGGAFSEKREVVQVFCDQLIRAHHDGQSVHNLLVARVPVELVDKISRFSGIFYRPSPDSVLSNCGAISDERLALSR